MTPTCINNLMIVNVGFIHPGSKLSDFTYAVKYRYAYIKFFLYWIFWFVDGLVLISVLDND